jgi:hypothetical protein
VTTAPASTMRNSTNAQTPGNATQTQDVAAAAVSAILIQRVKVIVLGLAHVLAPMDVARTRTVQAHFAWTPVAGKSAMTLPPISALLHLRRCSLTNCSRSKLGVRTISVWGLGLECGIGIWGVRRTALACFKLVFHFSERFFRVCLFRRRSISLSSLVLVMQYQLFLSKPLGSFWHIFRSFPSSSFLSF